jgi:hypothetical protein
MARDLEPTLLTALSDTVLRPVFLIELTTSIETVRLATGIGSLFWSGSPVNEWIGVGDVVGLSPIGETREIRATGIKLTISNISADDVTMALTDAVQGLSLKVYLAALTDAGAIVVDPFLAFSGLTDEVNMIESGDTCTMEISAESDLLRLQIANESRFTHDFQQIRFPGDLGFEFVEQLQEFDLPFGPQRENVPISPRLVSRQ